MILKRIEMAGFKSFADKTVLEFDQSFSAIVGPNGCGKSNVADAIRWVLGEQKVKDLRADSMQDVIFNGTEKRKSLSYCEVSLHFDNSTRFFDKFDYDELIITRKLYRSGESEYLINNNTCRLLDINNILYNSGLGKNGYSIIGQGKVTELVEAKPEARRYMFEDAAGISKYKKDKTDAENKLSKTRSNLERVNDILLEIDRQMGPLKKQAENAKKYLELKGQLKDLEVNAYVYQYENASTVKDKINQKLDSIKEELALRQTELNEATESYDKSMEQLDGFDKNLAEINNKILELTVGLEKEEGETRLVRERINFTQREIDRINLDLTNAAKMMELSIEQKREKENEKADLKEKLNSLQLGFNELSEKYSKILQELSLSQDEQDQSQQQIIKTLGNLTDVSSNLSRLEAEKENLTDKITKIDQNIALQADRKKELTTSLDEVNLKIKGQSDELLDVNKQQSDLSLKLSLSESSSREKVSTLANLTTQIKVLENRKKLLSEMQAEFEGYNYSVKKLLKEGEKAGLKSKMVGVVASLLSVPQKYETAIEVALGNNVQNIITYDEDGAKALINYLKENKFGRATFLPISSMRRREFDKRLIAGKKGVFGVADEIVTFDKKIENVVSNLLGGTVVVDSLETAVLLAKETRYVFKIVTLEGDIINPAGSMTGGSKKSEGASLMGRDREIADITTEIKNLEQKKQSLEAEVDTLIKEQNKNKEALNLLLEKKNALTINLTSQKLKSESLILALNDCKDDLSSLEKEATSLKNNLELIVVELNKSKSLKSALSGNKEDADNIIKERQQRFAELRNSREELSSNLTVIKVELAQTESSLELASQEVLRLTAQIEKLEGNILAYKEALDKNNAFIASAEDMIKQKIANGPMSQNKIELESYTKSRENIENEKTELSVKIKELDRQKAQIMDSLNKVNDKKYREEMNLSKVDSDIEIMQERIYEEYTLTYNDCIEFKRPDFDISVAMPEISKLKRSISALGAVNVNAIEDVKALLDRYNDLNTQAEDLKKAEEDLTKIIKDLSTIMIEKFEEELNKINDSFKITFRELFGGGTAKLELSDPSQPLESGVEVFVQPPGKKIQNMMLYSGGEKSLTAMAIIFAILRVKPLPFCLFDEVEAALDDTNVEIVDKYVKKLSTQTQFILITHKKPTMENADALFGVTMEEKGVSKIVSVKLADAIKQAEQDA